MSDALLRDNVLLAMENDRLRALAEAVRAWDAAQDAEACRLLHNAWVEYLRGGGDEG